MSPRTHPPTRTLRAHPDLDQLKRQAKELLKAYAAGDVAAVEEVSAHYHGASPGDFALHHAQLVLARAYGFESWPQTQDLRRWRDGGAPRRGGARRRSRRRAPDPGRAARARQLRSRRERRAQGAARRGAAPAAGNGSPAHAARCRRSPGHLAASRRDRRADDRRGARL